MTTIADTIDDLTAEWFTETLRTGGTIGPDTRVVSADSELIGTGQLGLVVGTHLTYDGGSGPQSLVVKLPSADTGSRQLGATMGVYEAEVRFYQEIAPTVKAHIPGVHFADLEPGTGRFTVVIDDLSTHSAPGDTVGGGTPEQATLAIGELPKLQVPGWNSPELRAKPWLADLQRTEMMFGNVEPALPEFLDRFADRLDPQDIDLARRLAPKARYYTRRVFTPPFVVAHGDYRLDNFMFGTTPTAPPVTIIDWQGARLAPPLLDAATYLGSCLTPEQRRDAEEGLLRSYHAALQSGGVTDFTWDDCWNSYRACSLWSFLLCIAVSVTLERTERGDAMWARLSRYAAQFIRDVNAETILD